MKKDKYITRTITTTEFRVLGINMQTMQVETRDFSLPGKFFDCEVTLNKIKAANTDKEFIVSAIRHIDYKETLYGVTVEQFLKIAKELPPRFSNETEE